MRYNQITERTEDEVRDDELSLFVSSIQNLITSRRRAFRPAADIYHDVIMKGYFVDWLQENVVPIWEKYGYPEIGSRSWGEFEREVIETFLK